MVLDENVLKQAAEEWAHKYALVKDEVIQADIAELLSKSGLSGADAGRLLCAVEVLATKEIASRMRMRR